MGRVVVVGGGVGGLAAAIRLRALGHEVTLLERRSVLGGKLAVHEREGFVFDVGPSLVTLPYVFDELFRAAGTTLEAEVPMVRLDPQFRYRWRDGRCIDLRDDGCDEPGWEAFVARGKQIWEVSERTFFAGPMSNPWSLLRRMRRPTDLLAIDALRTLDRAARRDFEDPHLVQWAGRYATYSGSSPYRAPATLGCIAHVESAFGCWYPVGGLGAIRDALVRVSVQLGVGLRCDAEVAAIETSTANRATARVIGVRLVGGEHIDAEVVVANTDAAHLYRDLLPHDRALRRVQRAQPSTSGFVVLAGVAGTTADIAHHNIWFSDDAQREFGELDAGRLPDDPTIYGCVSSVSDATQAPAGCENWFLLVNAPAGLELDRDQATDLVLDRLAEHGVDLRSRATFVESITPNDLAQRYRSPGGAIYGTSSNGRRAAFVRPGNRGAVPGLYLVGGSAHPGGGLPLVLISARIVAGLVRDDSQARR